MLCFCSREPHRDRTLSVVKAKCFRVICKEVDKAINDDVARARGGIVSVTFHDDVFLGLNFCFATRASGGEVGKNLCLYSPMGAWPVVMWVKRVQRELVNPMTGSVRATEVDSRRFLRELDEAPGGNNLQYILKCSCIPFFGNQELHNEIILGGNGGALRGHV